MHDTHFQNKVERWLNRSCWYMSTVHINTALRNSSDSARRDERNNLVLPREAFLTWVTDQPTPWEKRVLCTHLINPLWLPLPRCLKCTHRTTKHDSSTGWPKQGTPSCFQRSLSQWLWIQEKEMKERYLDGDRSSWNTVFQGQRELCHIKVQAFTLLA